MPDLKNLPDVSSQEQSKKFISYLYPLQIFYRDESHTIQTSSWVEPYILKSDWKIIKQQIDSWYKKHKLNDKRVKELNKQPEKDIDSGMKIIGDGNKTKSKLRKGFIYVLKLKDQPIYKIGASLNPQEPRKNIQNFIPLECVLLRLIPSNDMYSDEQKLHDLFKDKKIDIPDFKKQEWFKLNTGDLNFLMNIDHKNLMFDVL